MNLRRFVDERSQRWDRLESLIGRSRGRPERLSSTELLELGSLYRGTIADLAWARRRAQDDLLTQRLSSLAVRARQLVYSTRRRGFAPIRFITKGYWQLIAERPAPLLAAVAFLLVPAVLAALWAQADPGSAAGLVPAEFRDVLSPGLSGTDQGLNFDQQAQFSAYLIVNNVTVSILAFAVGIFFCIGGAWVMVNNGLILGAMGGLLAAQGDGAFFVELVAAHGILELSCIVIAGAAGFRMGWALVEPGNRTRREALRIETDSAIKIVVGTIPWFIVAGIIEAFVSRSGAAATPMAIVGVIVGGAYWLLIWLGRPARPEAAQTRAFALVSR